MPLARIRGPIDDKGADWLIVTVGGIGLVASVPTPVADAVEPGQGIALYTHLHVREDALTLYGFITREDLVLFEQLISVSGVGPRVALGMLSSMDAPQLAAAIVGGRSDLLRKAPGVGQKTAERIVLDLRDKVTPPPAGVDAERKATLGAGVDADVVTALMALGYTQNEATEAAGALPVGPTASLEDKIRAALAAFART